MHNMQASKRQQWRALSNSPSWESVVVVQVVRRVLHVTNVKEFGVDVGCGGRDIQLLRGSCTRRWLGARKQGCHCPGGAELLGSTCRQPGLTGSQAEIGFLTDLL